MESPATVDEYIASVAPEQRAPLEQMRATIHAAAPGAAESIAYQMPSLRLDGQFLVSYAAFRNHFSLFPASAVVVDELGDEIRPYLSGKGTIRFPANRPIPAPLVTRVVEIRVREVTAAVEARVARGTGQSR